MTLIKLQYVIEICVNVYFNLQLLVGKYKNVNVFPKFKLKPQEINFFQNLVAISLGLEVSHLY